MISVGIDNKSLWSQVAQSADTENDNIPDENDVVTPDFNEEQEDPNKADPVYSKENLEVKLESAKVHFEKLYEGNKVPCYNTEKIFDLVKIITSTIIGEPRLNFKAPRFESAFYCYEKVAAFRYNHKENLKDKFLYVVDTHGLSHVDNKDINYIDDISYDNKDFSTVTEVAKLLNKTGEYGLKMLAGTLIKTDYKGEKDPVKQNVRVAYTKLAMAVNRYATKIKETLGLYEDGSFFNEETRVYKSETEFNFSEVVEDLLSIYENFKTNYENFRLEFNDVVENLYTMLALYLTGALINIGEKAGITIATLFDKNSVKDGVDTFIDRVNTVVDKDTENKLFSLFYCFYLIHNFYVTYSTLKIDDVFVLPAVTIGKTISEMEEKIFNDNLVDISELTQSDLTEYKLNFRAYLDTPSLLKDTAYTFSLLPSYDVPSKTFVAAKAYRIFEFDTGESETELPLCPICGFITANTLTSDYTEVNVEKFYFYFLHSLIEEMPLVCSPKNFYKIAVSAALFRMIKHFATGDVKKLAALGLYQAEGYLVYLYREWFESGKIYKIDDSVNGYECDSSIKTLTNKAKIMCAQILSELSYHSTYNEPSEGRNWNIMNFEKEFYDGLMHADEFFASGKEPKSLIYTSYHNEAIKGVNNDNPEDYFDFISQFNRDEISFVNVYADGRESQNFMRINQILENEYNQETIDKLGDLKSKVENEDREMISPLLLGKCVAANIKDILSDEASKDRFTVFFNAFLKGTGMIYLAKDSYAHILTDQKDNILNIGKDKTDIGNDEYLSLLPHVQSMRTFNFLNRN